MQWQGIATVTVVEIQLLATAITLFGYFGVGFYGLLLLFICMQVELEPNGVSHHQRSIGIGFFKCLGVGLTVLGFGGFLSFLLG